MAYVRPEDERLSGAAPIPVRALDKVSRVAEPEAVDIPPTRRRGIFWEQWIFYYSGDHGAWGWMVSPRANISTNWSMRLERVSGFLAFPIL